MDDIVPCPVLVQAILVWACTVVNLNCMCQYDVLESDAADSNRHVYVQLFLLM